jgi:hypothetical protein
MRRPRQRRSRRTWLAAAVASAAALLIAGAVVGATVFPNSPKPTQTVAMQAMQPTPRGGLTAQLAVTEKKWGTELNWACQYTKDWSRNVKSYDIVVTTHTACRRCGSVEARRERRLPVLARHPDLADSLSTSGERATSRWRSPRCGNSTPGNAPPRPSGGARIPKAGERPLNASVVDVAGAGGLVRCGVP